MASAEQNSNISLLPQPTIPVPIEPMRGGGSGVDTSTVSLLPQPAVPVTIEPMRGGGSEDVSLLPQPDVPAVIQPMRGGGKYPGLELVEFQTSATQDVKIPKLDPIVLTKDIVKKYINSRKEIWGIEEKPKDNWVIQEDGKEVEFTLVKSKEKFFQHNLEENSQVTIFFIYNKDQFAWIFKRINKEPDENFILISKIGDDSDFSIIYKTLIAFIPDHPKTYFLFDKDIRKLVFLKGLGNTPQGEKLFRFVEPNSIKITFTKGEKPFSIIFSPNKRNVGTLDDTSIAVVGDSEGVEKMLDFVKRKQKTILLPSLELKQIYSVLDKARNFWKSVFLDLDEKEGELTIPPTEPEKKKEEAAKKEEDTLKEDQKKKEEEKKESVPTPVVVKYVIERKDTIPVQIGAESFELRKATQAVQDAWGKSEFSKSENAFLSSIGLSEAFFKENPSDRKTEFLKKIPIFLTSLVVSRCFHDTRLLLRSECEKARDFVRELYELKHLDRLTKITTQLKDITQYNVSIVKKPTEAEAVLDILMLIKGFSPKSKTRKYLYFTDLVVPGVFLGLETAPSSASAAAAASSSIPPTPPSIFTIFGRRLATLPMDIFTAFGRRQPIVV